MIPFTLKVVGMLEVPNALHFLGFGLNCDVYWNKPWVSEYHDTWRLLALSLTLSRDIRENSFEITDDSIVYRLNIPISHVIKTSYFFASFLDAHSGTGDRFDFGAGAYLSSLGGGSMAS